jgi:hypothetical protein
VVRVWVRVRVSFHIAFCSMTLTLPLTLSPKP